MSEFRPTSIQQLIDAVGDLRVRVAELEATPRGVMTTDGASFDMALPPAPRRRPRQRVAFDDLVAMIPTNPDAAVSASALAAAAGIRVQSLRVQLNKMFRGMGSTGLRRVLRPAGVDRTRGRLDVWHYWREVIPAPVGMVSAGVDAGRGAALPSSTSGPDTAEGDL